MTHTLRYWSFTDMLDYDSFCWLRYESFVYVDSYSDYESLGLCFFGSVQGLWTSPSLLFYFSILFWLETLTYINLHSFLPIYFFRLPTIYSSKQTPPDFLLLLISPCEYTYNFTSSWITSSAFCLSAFVFNKTTSLSVDSSLPIQ